MSENQPRSCPLKNIAMAIKSTRGSNVDAVHHEMASNMASSMGKSPKGCGDDCAWFVNDKCAITVIAEKIK